MIGSGLKKLAREHSMTIDKGLAYGSFYGYAATLYEGSGWKEINVSCLFPDAEKAAQLQTMLNGHNLMKEYRVSDLALAPDGMRIRFYDNPGTMKKLRAFCEWFFPQLPAYGATGAEICTQCGMPLSADSTWHLVGDMAVHMHPSCANRLQHAEERKAQAEAEEAINTSYMSGAIGALIGALIGAVIWGAVLYLGYYASVVGILIGVLASKGYDMAHGRQKKGKILILLVVTILAVMAGTLGAYGFSLFYGISTGELAGYAYGDIPWMLGYLMVDNTFMKEFLTQIGLGLLYALLGLSVVLVRVHKETKEKKIEQLK